MREKFAAQLASPGKPIHFESTLLGRTGRRWQVAWDSTALRDDKHKVKAVANIGRDITQEKAVESHLRQAQKVESIGRLAGGIVHDFNNLLAVIGGYASHLLIGTPLEIRNIPNSARSGMRSKQGRSSLTNS